MRSSSLYAILAAFCAILRAPLEGGCVMLIGMRTTSLDVDRRVAIVWRDGYRFVSDGTQSESAGKSASETYIPIAADHEYTVFCGAGGTANRYAHAYTSDRTRITSIVETKASATFSFVAPSNAAFLRMTANTDAKDFVYVHDDTTSQYVVKNGLILTTGGSV